MGRPGAGDGRRGALEVSEAGRGLRRLTVGVLEVSDAGGVGQAGAGGDLRLFEWRLDVSRCSAGEETRFPEFNPLLD